MIRIVKLYKNALLARANLEKQIKEREEEELRKQSEERSSSNSTNIMSPSSNGKRRSSNINPNLPVILQNTPQINRSNII